MEYLDVCRVPYYYTKNTSFPHGGEGAKKSPEGLCVRTATVHKYCPPLGG